jgi:hypothetical protein
MSERVFPIGDSQHFNTEQSHNSEELNLVKLTGPSGREVQVLPIQIDDPAIIERAMKMNIYGSDNVETLASNLAVPGKNEVIDESHLTFGSPVFDQTATAVIGQKQAFSPIANELDFNPYSNGLTTSS